MNPLQTPLWYARSSLGKRLHPVLTLINNPLKLTRVNDPHQLSILANKLSRLPKHPDKIVKTGNKILTTFKELK
jgi:hypothetical protein